MSNNVIRVNWTQLSKMGVNTLKNSSDFEEARKMYQEIINSLPECWEGTDQESFMKNCNDFLDELKKDTAHLADFGAFFNKSSSKYTKVEDEHKQNINKINKKLQSMEMMNNYTMQQMNINSLNIVGDFDETSN